MRRWNHREGYKPFVSVKNVSISHCPPGRGRGGVKMEKRGGEGGERCQRSTRQMDEEDNCRLRYKNTFKISFPLIQHCKNKLHVFIPAK